MGAFSTSDSITGGIQGRLWQPTPPIRAVEQGQPLTSTPSEAPLCATAPGEGDPARAVAGVGGHACAGTHGAALRSAWSDLLGRHPLDTFFTCTFTPEYAAEHYIYSHTSALNNFERWLRSIDYPGDFFCASEDHFDRDTPHLHGLMDSRGIRLSTFWADWYHTRGRARFEEPRTDAARVYCTKYALKDEHGDSLRFRLSRPLSRRERARWRDEIATPS